MVFMLAVTVQLDIGHLGIIGLIEVIARLSHDLDRLKFLHGLYGLYYNEKINNIFRSVADRLPLLFPLDGFRI